MHTYMRKLSAYVCTLPHLLQQLSKASSLLPGGSQAEGHLFQCACQLALRQGVALLQALTPYHLTISNGVLLLLTGSR